MNTFFIIVAGNNFPEKGVGGTTAEVGARDQSFLKVSKPNMQSTPPICLSTLPLFSTEKVSLFNLFNLWLEFFFSKNRVLSRASTNHFERKGICRDIKF
jgi:hypothetical protein